MRAYGEQRYADALEAVRTRRDDDFGAVREDPRFEQALR
jgi:hypothetical protein